MPELLFEIGCEELPPHAILDASEQLEAEIVARIEALGLSHGKSSRYSTPRRLIVSVLDVPAELPATTERVRGPSAKVAFDESGQPTVPLQKFCEANGSTAADAIVEDGYVYVDRTTPARPTAEALGGLLAESAAALRFPKTMRWGAGVSFARPVRWVLAAFDGRAVDMEFAGVRAGLASRGHRFYAQEPFEAKSVRSLLSGLRKRKVEPDPAKRQKLIRAGAKQVSGGRAIIADSLVEENANLTEWPQALLGSFPPEHLSLPDPVLKTAMASYERFFPVLAEGGGLANDFVSIRNAGRDDEVRTGNEWVLNARFNDAAFFHREDSHLSLDQMLEATESLSFQSGLGTVRQRAERLSQLTPDVASALAIESGESARLAGLYAKADLGTGLVRELPALQGVIGGEYARRDGLPEDVCAAIAAQYDPNAVGLGLALLAADQLDRLVGFLGVGQAPSGSFDPYGLRRAASLLIEATWRAGAAVDWRILAERAAELYQEQGFDLKPPIEPLGAVLKGRYEALMPEVRYDVLDAAADEDTVFRPFTHSLRCGALAILASDTAFVRSATRPINIVNSALEKGIAFPSDPIAAADPQGFEVDSAEGDALARALAAVAEPLHEGIVAADPAAVAAAVRPLQAPIDAFFESTMVMVEDERLRGQRLGLLNSARMMLYNVGDFSALVIE